MGLKKHDFGFIEGRTRVTISTPTCVFSPTLIWNQRALIILTVQRGENESVKLHLLSCESPRQLIKSKTLQEIASNPEGRTRV